MRVGKNTYFLKNKKYICIDCKIQKNNKLKKYICDECNEYFVILEERYKLRMLKYNKCLCLSCSKKGERNPFFNKNFTVEQKEKMSKKRLDYYNNSENGLLHRRQQSRRWMGEGNPQYKGIEYCSNYYTRNKTIRKQVLLRDNNICQYCKQQFPTSEL